MKKRFHERKGARLSVVKMRVGEGVVKRRTSLEKLIRGKVFNGVVTVELENKVIEEEITKRRLISLLRLTKSRSLNITKEKKYVSTHDRKRTKSGQRSLLVYM